MKYNIAEIIDVQKISHLLESYTKATGLVSALLDLEGNILAKSGWQKICTHFHRVHPESADNCRMSDTILANKLSEGGEFNVYKCLNGLIDVAVPIKLNNIHIGNLFTGQFFFEKPNESFFKQQAKKYNFDEASYLSNLAEVPILKESDIKYKLDFLIQMTEVIAELGYSKMLEFQSKEALAKSENKYRSLFENAIVGTVINKLIRDESGKAIDFLHLDANPATKNHLGVEPDQVIGFLASQLVSKSETKYMVSLNEKVVNTGKPYNIQRYYKEFDKTIDLSAFHIEDDFFVSTFFDVSEKKRAEENLRESEEKFRTLLDHSIQGVLLIQDRKVTYVNKAQLKITGLSYKETKNLLFEEHLNLLHPDDRQSAISRQARFEQGETVNETNQIRIIHKDGSIRWVLASSVTFTLLGKPARMGLMVDITEQKNAEEEIRQLNRNLESSVKERTLQLEEANQELEAFSYSISHDLRAPLRAINGYSNFLFEDFSEDLDDEAKRFISNIKYNATKMDQLISDLLNFSRVSKSSINRIKADMQEIILSIYQDIATDEEKQAFEFKLDEMPLALFDVSLILQVWQNLIGNALKYSSKSNIKKIEISVIENDNEFIYCIKDYGAGFNEKYKSKLFGVFQRLHGMDDFDGTGIGLAIVKRIVHRHGGRVWAKGKEYEGASFYFTLPKNIEN